MSVGISGVDSVLARIAQIESRFAPARPVAVSTSSSASSAVSASSLDSAALSSTALGSAGLSTAGLSGTALSGTGASGAGTTAGVSADFAAALAGVQATPTTGGGVTGDEVVASAKKYLGIPYVFGGTTTAGLDCSGLVQKAYGDLGISLPRIAADQARTGTAVPSLAQARPGDILGFGQPAHHVAIYLGNNMMIAAPEPGENVKIQSVYETPASIRRIVSGSDTTTTASATSSPVGSGTAGVAQYSAIFAQNESRYQLPKGMLAAVAQTESGGNAKAVSPSGAQGLMQLMPGTARGLGVSPWVPAQAVQGAAQLLSKYLHTFGSVPLALAAYNAGPGAVEQYGGVPPYTETQNYVRKITALMAEGS